MIFRKERRDHSFPVRVSCGERGESFWDVFLSELFIKKVRRDVGSLMVAGGAIGAGLHFPAFREEGLQFCLVGDGLAFCIGNRM